MERENGKILTIFIRKHQKWNSILLGMDCTLSRNTSGCCISASTALQCIFFTFSRMLIFLYQNLKLLLLKLFLFPSSPQANFWKVFTFFSIDFLCFWSNLKWFFSRFSENFQNFNIWAHFPGSWMLNFSKNLTFKC